MEKQTITVAEAAQMWQEYYVFWLERHQGYWIDTIHTYETGNETYPLTITNGYRFDTIAVKPDMLVRFEYTPLGAAVQQRDIATDALRALCDSDTIEAWCADNGIQLDSVQQIRYHRMVEHIAKTVLARMDDEEADA